MKIKNKMRQNATLACAVTLLSVSLKCSTQAGVGGSKIAPANADPQGHSMAAWAEQYWSWQVLGQPAAQQFGHVLFPVGPACSISGSGTLADPLIISLCAEFTIKAGTAFADPGLTQISELYADGSTDPLPTEQWWSTYAILTEPVVLDGKTVVTENNIANYYVNYIYNPPVMYPQPTSYGSIGIHGLVGWMMFVEPLSVGVHHLSAAAGVFAPADNGFFPFEIGEIIRADWTIKVVP
jgi:hypothetical protein